MNRYLLVLALVLVAADDYAADPVQPIPVILPVQPQPPTPPPPKVPTKLAADQIYLIRSSMECQIIDGTEGIVTVTPMTGPATIRGKFTDGTGVETRTLNDKYLYLVTSASAGKTDLIITWAGGKLRVCLDVGGDTPKPPDPPAPDTLLTALQTAYNSERNATSLATLQTAYAKMSAAAPAQTFKTNGEASTWIAAQAPAATILPATRKVIMQDLAASLGGVPTTPLDMKAFAVELAKINSALQGVK